MTIKVDVEVIKLRRDEDAWDALCAKAWAYHDGMEVL